MCPREAAMERESDEERIPNMTTGRPCPMMQASLLSYLTWQWMQPVITIGNSKILEAEDLYDLVPDECALECEKRWLKAMEEEKAKKKKRISVWKLLWKSMGYKFMLGGLYKPVWMTSVILQVYILRELVRSARSTEALHWWWATLLVLGMGFTTVVQSICQHMSFTIGQRTGMKARATVALAVFNKGIASVRAFGAEKRMHDQFIAMIDANHRAFILFVHASRWLGIRLDIAAAFCVSVASLLVILLRHSISPGLAGVVLVQSLQLSGFFQYGVRLAADTENYFTSVERIQTYSKLPTEAGPDSAPGTLPEDWPQNGEVEFVHYTMAYREDLPPVLNDLCFKVKAQEKVGILGRTGAGKSSLAAAMFRLVENKACSGSILIDGIDISHVGLDDLRRRLSIIPQDPVLFRGTVRLNLDPFEQHTDAEINEAIARVHLSTKIESLDIGIDSIVAENGENFSVGQRQLLCLARSLLRRKHRSDTIIDCHRVLVLAKEGRVAEFDTAANLLRRAQATAAASAFEDHSPAAVPAVGDYGFADSVAQSGPAIAKQLREAAEAAELQRQQQRS